MNKLVKRITLGFLAVILSFVAIYAEQSIAVLNIKSSVIEKDNCISVTNFMTAEMEKIPDFRVIAWDDVAKMLEHEAGRQKLGCDNEKCISEIGGALGVDYIVAGDIGSIGNRYVCNLRLIDINKASTKNRVSEVIKGNIGLLIDLLPNMVRRLLSVEDLIPVSVKNAIYTNSSVKTLTDIDGNVYKTVKIGNQIWTAENLRTTKFNDGTPISNLTDGPRWLFTSNYCYNDSITNISKQKKYGALYNYYAVNTGKLAPKGWHVPTNADWTELDNYLITNGYNWDETTSGNKFAKSLASKTDWKLSKKPGDIGKIKSSNNRTGFTAFPGGFRTNGFNGQGVTGIWWSATSISPFSAFDYSLDYDNSFLDRSHSHKRYLYSVRLVKD